MTIALIELDSCSSTNDWVLEALQEQPRIAAFTLNQTAGRGTKGRTWYSPPNHSLAFSFGLSIPKDSPAIPGRFNYPLFAGLGVCEVVKQFDPQGQLPLKIKWPNDVLLEGKLCGILCESRWKKDAVHVVMGIGINLHGSKEWDSLPQSADNLGRWGVVPSGLMLANSLKTWLEDHLLFYQNQAALQTKWLSWSMFQPGDKITIQEQTGTETGTFCGLDHIGNLKLELPSGQIRIVDQACEQIKVVVEGNLCC